MHAKTRIRLIVVKKNMLLAVWPQPSYLTSLNLSFILPYNTRWMICTNPGFGEGNRRCYIWYTYPTLEAWWNLNSTRRLSLARDQGTCFIQSRRCTLALLIPRSDHSASSWGIWGWWARPCRSSQPVHSLFLLPGPPSPFFFPPVISQGPDQRLPSRWSLWTSPLSVTAVTLQSHCCFMTLQPPIKNISQEQVSYFSNNRH